MQVDLADDRFDVTYDPAEVEVSALLASIRKLDYEPEVVEPATSPKAETASRVDLSDLPPELSSLFAEASKSDKPLLIQFSGPG